MCVFLVLMLHGLMPPYPPKVPLSITSIGKPFLTLMVKVGCILSASALQMLFLRLCSTGIISFPAPRGKAPYLSAMLAVLPLSGGRMQ